MPTANEEYWNHFSVTDTDIERLYGFVLEHARPISSPDLVRQIVEQRVRDEEERRARYNAEITLYQPKLEYQVGQGLIFSKLNDTHGVVTAVRPGDNPRLPPFQVVTVRLEGAGDSREFASLFDLPHPLNEETATSTATSDLSAEQVLGEYGAAIENQVLGRLRRDREFVEQDGRWLLRGLLMPVSEYHLNLAEAAIEQAFEQDKRAPATLELASVLEISGDAGKKGTLVFSIEYALRHDNRFADVGRLGEPHWSLTRLIPLEAQQVPPVLELAQVSVPGQLPPELEAVVAELEGQADVSSTAAPHGGPTPLLSVALTYPHRRAGSLPLTAGLKALLPESDRRAMLIWLVDEATGSKMPGWVVREGNYLAGLKPWYDQRKLNPGAFIQLQRRPEPQTLSIEYQGQRERSLWVRVARVQGGQLTFTQERRPVGHKYDEEMLILVGDQNALDTYHNQNRGDRPIEALLIDIFPELAKLVPGGRVHAKTLFGAVNFARRIGPRPVFQALAQSSAFASLGGGYYALETARDFAR